MLIELPKWGYRNLSFENEIIKEVSYFTAKEEYTNSYPTQTILNAPKTNMAKLILLKKLN